MNISFPGDYPFFLQAEKMSMYGVRGFKAEKRLNLSNGGCKACNHHAGFDIILDFGLSGRQSIHGINDNTNVHLVHCRNR